MNERIKELSEQAHMYARDYVEECKHYGYHMEHNEFELRFESKFAELIIKETLQVARAGVEFGDGMDSAVYTYFDLKDD